MINTLNIKIWDRDFSLSITYDCYKGETITDEQIKAVENLSSNVKLIEKAKKEVEKFCKDNVKDDKENKKKDNIFSYIKPDFIFVKHEEKPRIAIMCKYRYDQEHGLAVVFTIDGKIQVGLQDIIL